MNKKLIKTGIIVTLVISIVAIAFFTIKSIPVPEITVNPIDLNLIADGYYQGEYTDAPVSAKVTVQVKEHRITSITINEHRNGLGSKAETIVDDIIALQKIDVDVISGATQSSYVIRKAVEVALAKD